MCVCFFLCWKLTLDLGLDFVSTECTSVTAHVQLVNKLGFRRWVCENNFCVNRLCLRHDFWILGAKQGSMGHSGGLTLSGIVWLVLGDVKSPNDLARCHNLAVPQNSCW